MLHHKMSQLCEFDVFAGTSSTIFALLLIELKDRASLGIILTFTNIDLAPCANYITLEVA